MMTSRVTRPAISSAADGNFTDYISLKGQYAFLQGINLYELDKWRVGQTSLLNPFSRLSGYHGYEFRTDSSSLVNLNLLIALPGGRSGFMINHDLFYMGKESRLYQGSGMGYIYKISESLEVSLWGRYGWNHPNGDVSRGNGGVYLKYLKIRGN